jgi:heme oxygenase
VLRTRPYSTPAHPPSFTREQEIWGALYAIEGSRLGNRVMVRRVMECGSEDERHAIQFLADGLKDRTAWSEFVAKLDDLHDYDKTFESAVLGAERVFETYLNSAERYSGWSGLHFWRT